MRHRNLVGQAANLARELEADITFEGKDDALNHAEHLARTLVQQLADDHQYGDDVHDMMVSAQRLVLALGAVNDLNLDS